MSVMESITNFFAQCPLVNPELPFYLDYVSESDCYCISTVPNVPYKKDILGNKTYTVSFVFAYRTAISDDSDRSGNIAFLEQFNAWVDERNEAKDFPKLPPNCAGISLKITNSGALDEVSEDGITGIYETQLQFIYKERKVM